MPGRIHERTHHTALSTLIAGLLVAATSPAAAASGAAAAELPACAESSAATSARSGVAEPWRAVLDTDGAVVAYRMTLRRGVRETEVRTGRRGFAVAAGDDRMLIGERSASGTHVTMLDVGRACRLWTRQLERLAYPDHQRARPGALRLALHEAGTRRYEGSLIIDPESGASEGLIDGECIEGCAPNDGDLSSVAFEPAGAPQPTPNFAAGGWPKDKQLRFRWGTGAAPPSWARSALMAAADDAWRTSQARSPRFVYRSDADDAISYGAETPGYCGGSAIACAGRAMPSTWGVWLLPHRTDFSWGILKWCQKSAASSGCFDIRRVLLHELGHIAGLNHPSNAGFTLASGDSVMQGITPVRPRPGSSRHAFGRCDVATLQELYDTTDNKTAISTCNDVATKLALSSSRTSVSAGGSVKLTAELRVTSKSAYRQLAGNPLNGRSVKLKYRRSGSADAWQTAWMRSLYSSGRYELTISPASTWEFRAVFPTPGDEGLRYSRSGDVKVKVKG